MATLVTNDPLVDPRPQMSKVYTELPSLDRATLKGLLSDTSSEIKVQELSTSQASTFSKLAETLNKFFRKIHVVHIDAHGEYGLLCEVCDSLSPHGIETCSSCDWTFPVEQKAQGHIAFETADSDLEWVNGQKLGKALVNRGI